ncbi:hypothetical protein [Pedobacter aquatilis]|uniref:hypothetical protein n=1 Tax=Pedobacter aquatilis TaxID=351343 RepID=UPI00292E938E|nr:hypothetical protein [Pedobacter aquatilis]
MTVSKFAPELLISKIQEYYTGREPEEVCSELKIDMDEFNHYILLYGQIANELLEIKDENEKLRHMFINISLVNQSLRNSLDLLTKNNPALFNLLNKKKHL